MGDDRGDQQAADWWRGAVGYEVYVRSFADTDGDGVGDLPGVRAKLPYLADLGVDVVWVTPFYPSPQADHGYDVADHLGVDPRFGTLDDLEALLSDAHALGLRVLIDLVPNHTSDTHPWFVDSRSSRDATHRSWYVWRDGRAGGPPNNWVSHFGGPAWTYDDTTSQWYMHLFLPEQPDLNWAEPAVWEAFRDIIDTWFARGADGIRIDVAHSLVEDPEFRDNPPQPEPLDTDGDHTGFDTFSHQHDVDQEGVLDVYRDWRPIAAGHDAMLLGEVYLLDPVRLARYVRGDGLDAAFCFDTLKIPWDADTIRDTLRTYLERCGDRLAWPLSSHDDSRAASRFGGGELGARRALSYFTFLCGLPGMPFLYQGDELGLDDGELTGSDVAQDPVALRNAGAPSRDPQRTPMTWEPGPGYGFTIGEPWLPFGKNRSDDQTAARQLGDPTSHLERTRSLLSLRRRLPALTGATAVTWVIDDGPVLAVERDAEVLVLLHVGDGEGPAALSLPEPATLLYATDDDCVVIDDELLLPEDAAAIVALSAEVAAAARWAETSLTDDERTRADQLAEQDDAAAYGGDEVVA